MTSLNSKLQLAMLNRKKGRNLLEKGFTLVELMIVIVIVGILSSVALPSFLNQRNKAEATEAVTQISTLLKEAGLMNMEGMSAANIVATISGSVPSATDPNLKFSYSAIGNDATTPTLLCITGTHKTMTTGSKYVNGTIALTNLSSGAATQKTKCKLSTITNRQISK